MNALGVFDIAEAENKARADERERIAKVLEGEYLEEMRYPGRAATELAYRKAHNDRTRAIVDRLRDPDRMDSLCT